MLVYAGCKRCGHYIEEDGFRQSATVEAEILEAGTVMLVVCAPCGGCRKCHKIDCECPVDVASAN